MSDKQVKSPRMRDDWPNHYSARNIALLAISGAQEVAGYREWQSIGRQVRKGAKGIALTAPIIKKDAETGERRMVNIRTVTVFDIAQTDAAAA